jgi:hypothetical protein
MEMLRVTIAALATCVALIAAGCGDDDDEESSATSDAVEQSSDGSDASYAISVDEFIAATDKKEILQSYVANEPNNCSKVDDDFVLTASAAATEFAADAPLEDVIIEICGEPPPG